MLPPFNSCSAFSSASLDDVSFGIDLSAARISDRLTRCFMESTLPPYWANTYAEYPGAHIAMKWFGTGTPPGTMTQKPHFRWPSIFTCPLSEDVALTSLPWSQAKSCTSQTK